MWEYYDSFHHVDAPNQQSMLPALNQLLTVDQRLQNSLVKARVNALSHYDDIVNNMEALSTTLAAIKIKYQRLIPEEMVLIQPKLSALLTTLSQYKKTVEQIKSDLAATRNSINYLPVLILESQTVNVNTRLQNISINAHKQMLALLDLHAYSDNNYWYNDFLLALEIIRKNETLQVKIYNDQIEKHIRNIEAYRPRIVQNYAIIDEQSFSRSIQNLISLIVEFDKEQHKSTDQLQTALQIVTLLVSIIALLSFYHASVKGAELVAENSYRTRVNDALAQLAKFDNRVPRGEFLDNCMANLINVSNAYIVFVAFFKEGSDTQMETMSVNRSGEKLSNFTYQLEGAPCEHVILNHVCVVESNVAHLYPTDEMLSDLELEAYFGQAIIDASGKTIGLIALTYQQTTKYESWLRSLMGIFATRISIELERSKAIAALHKEHEEAITTLNSIADSVIRVDSAGLITNINPVACQLFGIDQPSDIVNTHISTLTIQTEGDAGNSISDLVSRCIYRKGLTNNRIELSITPRNSTKPLLVTVSAAPILDNKVGLLGVIVVMSDITNEIKYRQELTYQANHDSLTGLCNRRALNAHLEKRVKNSSVNSPCGLLFIDMDRFKVINDTCGHSAGDSLLLEFSSLLKKHTRSQDVLARLGGDEFFICLENADLTVTTEIANKLLQKIRQFRFKWQSHEFQITVSIGLTIIDSSEYEQSQVVSAIDLACLKAKKSGRDQLAITSIDDPDITSQQSQGLWIQRLNKAISHNQFELYQQPIVKADSQSDSLDFSLYQHVEILLRMRDDSGSILMPHEFMTAAERYELMPRIDRWVVENVLSRMAGQTEKTSLMFSEFVAINLSGQSLADKKLLTDIKQLIKQYDINPKQLCFEITETSAIANLDNAIHLVKELRAIGCKFSLDDFGSGLSSYEYIKKLPIDILKIDREFTQQIEHDQVNQVILKSIIDVAHGLGMQAIAEGIEDLISYNVVKEMGIDYLQGYGIARPEAIEPVDEASTSILETI